MKLKEKVHKIIYEADTFYGKLFDVILLILIIISLVAVSIESIPEYALQFKEALTWVEWILTILFSLEYVLRIWSVRKPLKYIFSFYGIIDLLALLPAYLGLILTGTNYLITIRSLRLFRVFRIFKLTRLLKERHALTKAFVDSRAKITVFITFVLLFVFILGTIMYVIEGGVENTGFKNIPESIYWAIVTLTTVGYGDISPITPLGKFIASIIMVLGYGVIAVPTGMVSVELSKQDSKLNDKISTQCCKSCSKEEHDYDAQYCKYCGEKL